jgi:hypothetical protein
MWRRWRGVGLRKVGAGVGGEYGVGANRGQTAASTRRMGGRRLHEESRAPWDAFVSPRFAESLFRVAPVVTQAGVGD